MRTRTLLGVFSYVIVAVAAVSGATAFVFFAFQPAVQIVAPQQENPKVAPRVQAWQDRKAEGLLYAEKERAAALAEREQAQKVRMSIASTATDVMAPAPPGSAENERAVRAMARAHQDQPESGRPGRAKKRAQQEVSRRSEGYANETRWSSNPVRLHGPE